VIYDFGNEETLSLSGAYDICICGAGPAGIILARHLSLQGKKVALLEGGGATYTQQSQEIYKGRSVGLPYYLESWRLRYFGGTSNHWAGRCRPFESEDFRERDIDGLPGWPITFDEMELYLKEVKNILGLPIENTFNMDSNSKINSDKFEPDEFHTGNPVRFGEKYKSFLKSSELVDVYLNTNVVDILLEKDLKTVEKVKVKSFSGSNGYVSASNFILSMGAIENARLLLCSNSQIVEGIGNQTDMVGRCFMEHFNLDLGGFVVNTRGDQGTKSMAFFTTPAHSSKHDHGNSNISLGVYSKLRAYGRTAEFKKMFNKLSCDLGLSKDLQFIYKHKCTGEGVISTLCEQFPNKMSRVNLIDEKDKLGLKRVELNWNMSHKDEDSIRTIAIEFAKEFAKSGLGRVKLKKYILDKTEKIPSNAHAHQMGTTRMSKSHKDGVVNINCKVFETNNLYIAGSSVFSTGGGGNPTMPLLQLALRLGDHLLGKDIS